MKTPALVLCALALSAGATAQVSKQGSAYLFRVKYSKGQKLSYNLAATITMPPGLAAGPQKLTAPIIMVVKEVKAGVATIDYQAGPFLMNGRKTTEKQSAILKQDTRGRIVSGDATYTNVSSMALPEKPIKVGESWKAQTTTSAGGGQPVKMNATYTFRGIKTVKGKSVAVVGVVMKSAEGIAMAGSGDLTLLVSDGSVVTSSTSLKIEMGKAADGKPTSLTAVSQMTRV